MAPPVINSTPQNSEVEYDPEVDVVNLCQGISPNLFFWSSNLKRGHGKLAGAEAEDDDGGGAERDERRDEVGARGRGRVVRVQRQLVVAR